LDTSTSDVFIIKESGLLEDLKIDIIIAHPRASEIGFLCAN